jgi:hypothetical protein
MLVFLCPHFLHFYSLCSLVWHLLFVFLLFIS